MKKRITMAVLGASLLAGTMFTLAACSLLTKQETTQSNIPSAETLTAACNAGKAQTPPVRVGACDDYNTLEAAYQALVAQPIIPPGAMLPFQAGGYTLGNWTRE